MRGRSDRRNRRTVKGRVSAVSDLRSLAFDITIRAHRLAPMRLTSKKSDESDRASRSVDHGVRGAAGRRDECIPAAAQRARRSG